MIAAANRETGIYPERFSNLPRIDEFGSAGGGKVGPVLRFQGYTADTHPLLGDIPGIISYP